MFNLKKIIVFAKITKRYERNYKTEKLKLLTKSNLTQCNVTYNDLLSYLITSVTAGTFLQASTTLKGCNNCVCNIKINTTAVQT